MTTMKITKKEMEDQYTFPTAQFPKYTSQLINWANQNAQGTRPKVVGQLSELFPKFRNEVEEHSVASWAEWYQQRQPYAIDNATEKIEKQMNNLKEAIQLIDRQMIREWVEDLVINKTYSGLYYQQVILAHIAKIEQSTWRLASPEEESQGIDGYVGNRPFSVKPHTYLAMSRLQEHIPVTMIYYTIKASGDLSFEICD